MNTNARRWMDFLLPDALSVHTDWLRQFTAGDGQLLARFGQSRTARMLLTRRLYKLHEIAVPNRVKLRANQQWLLMGRSTDGRWRSVWAGMHSMIGFGRPSAPAQW